MITDLRFGLRMLWKSPAFTLVALVTLMLGIGANVVVFGVVNAVLLHPLDVSDRQNQLRLKPWTSFKLLTTSYPAFEDFRQRNTTFSGMAGYDVSRRMKELGIRVALGARTRHVMSAAVGRPIMLLGVGSLAGLLLGVFASQLLGHIVYQANSRDAVIVGGAVLTMALLGIAASAIPAVRALAVDPYKLLREE